MADPIRVVVAGASGKMGREIRIAVSRDPELQLVGGIDLLAPADAPELPFSTDPISLLSRVQPRVVVDFSTPMAAPGIARAALAAGASPLVGTSGLSAALVDEIRDAARGKGLGAAVVPNFAVGAVLMMHFAALASRFFESAEIVEIHHDTKIDSPSGTAIATAEAMEEAHGRRFTSNVPEKETLPGGRGANSGGVAIHSVRLPGFVARQEVIFGGLGQSLTLTHDTTSREAYMPGILLAIKAIVKQDRFVYGLAPLLGLEAQP